MIYDKLENLTKYLPKEYLLPINTFLQSISPNMNDGYYAILGDKVFARVMTYPTKDKEKCKIEAHNKYIDIQSSLVGAEGISIYRRDSLSVSEPYSKSDDVLFFQPQNTVVFAETVNYPGYFTMLFPNEAHRPQQAVSGINNVKKFVIKMEVDYFEK